LIKSGLAFVAVDLTDLALAFFALGRELRAVAEELLPAAAPLIVLSMALLEVTTGRSEGVESAFSAELFAAVF
jgi:hypothetical protein